MSILYHPAEARESCPVSLSETCNTLPGICRSTTILDVHRARNAILTKAEVQIQNVKMAQQQLCKEERKAKRQKQEEEFNRDCARVIAEGLEPFPPSLASQDRAAFANHHARAGTGPRLLRM